MTRAEPARVLAAVLGIAGAAACAPATRAHHHVEIAGLVFRPGALTVAPGDTVSWINRDIVPHTATAREGRWDSGEIPAGGSFTLVVGEPGELRYYCRYHPDMTAALSSR